MAISIKNVASDPTDDRQVLVLNSLQILRLLHGCLEPISVGEGEYRSSGEVLVFQNDPEDEKGLRRLNADYDREWDRLHNDGLPFAEANHRDARVWVSARYALAFTETGPMMQFKKASVLPESDWLGYDEIGELRPLDEIEAEDWPTECKLGDRTFPIMQMNPYEAMALFKNILGGLGVEKDEFASQGVVFIMVVPFVDEEQRAESRKNLMTVARERKINLKLPGPSVYENFYGLVVGFTDYQIVQQGEDEWAMMFYNPEKIPPKVVSEDGELVDPDGEE